MCFPLGLLPSPRAVSPLLLGRCCGAKSWKRNLFKVFRTHVNRQNLLTAELKYLFLLRNKALLLNLSTAGFVPQTGEKSLRGRNGQAGTMPLVCVMCLHSRKFAHVQCGSTSPHVYIPIASEGVRVAHKSGHILDIRGADVAARMDILSVSFEKLQVAICLPLTA